MKHKIRLQHPAGKNAISMDEDKYTVMEKSIVECLTAQGELTNTGMLNAINERFKRNKTLFRGTVEWHLEWARLDLEARNRIKRIADGKPLDEDLREGNDTHYSFSQKKPQSDL